MKSRIGIKDIALKAGVSKGTVDRVIHNRGNVSPDARKKVEAAMKELDYQPNVIASALASKKVRRIAVFIPDSKNDPFWEQPTSGILKAKKALRDYPISIDPYYFRDADRQHFLELGKKYFLKIMMAFLFLLVF
jgi:LacI family transcriptional regulator